MQPHVCLGKKRRKLTQSEETINLHGAKITTDIRISLIKFVCRLGY